jgi:hypothetical protein
MSRIASRTRTRINHGEFVDAGPTMATWRDGIGIVSSWWRVGRASMWRTILAGSSVPTAGDPGAGAFPPVAAGRSSQYWSMALTGTEAQPLELRLEWREANAGAAPSASRSAAPKASARARRGTRAIEIDDTRIALMLPDVRTP